MRALIGSKLRPGEDQNDGGDTLAILSYSLWQRRYHSDPNVVGNTVIMNGQPYAEIGVTEEGFKGIVSLSRADWVWVPMSMNQQLLTGLGREIFPLRRAVMVTTVGRLAPGVTLVQAQQALDPIAAQLEHDYPKDNGGRGVSVRPLEDGAIGINQRSQFVLSGGANLEPGRAHVSLTSARKGLGTSSRSGPGPTPAGTLRSPGPVAPGETSRPRLRSRGDSEDVADVRIGAVDRVEELTALD